MRKLDDSAVSVLLGFILVIMISMITLSVIQTTLVPDLCKKAEADHIDVITNEMLKANQITTSPFDLKLDMGVHYPRYPFLLTPPTASSTIYSEAFPVNISYVEILPNGSKVERTMNLVSKRIVLTPNYFYYPKTSLIVENTAIFRGIDNGFIVLAEQKAFKKTVSFVILNTTFSSLSTAGSVDLLFIPVSVGDGVLAEDITISFESVYPEYWNESLSQLGYEVNVSGNTVTVKISERISLAVLSYYVFDGISVSSPQSMRLMETLKLEPYRIVKINPLDTYELKLGETVDLGVKVLDEFNNPVEGIEVDVSVEGGIGDVSPIRAYSDEKGEVHVVFSAKNTGSGNVVFTCNGCTDVKSVEYGIVVSSLDSVGAPYTISWEKDEYEVYGMYGSKVSLEMTAITSPTAVNARVEFATDQPLSTAWFEPNTTFTDDSGKATTTLNIIIDWTDFYKIINAYVTTLVSGDTALVKIYQILTWIIDTYGDFDNGIFENVRVVEKDDGVDGYVILKSKTQNWLTGWSYRKEITVTERSGQDLNGYQVAIELDSNNFDFSKAKNNGDDIRITASDGVTLLPYWIEEWDSANEKAKIWVKLDLKADSKETIYLYYGNPVATSLSDGDSVFELFDDFEGTSLDTSKWRTNTNTYSVENGYIKMWGDFDGGDYYINSKLKFSSSVVVEGRWRLGEVGEDIDLAVAVMKDKDGVIRSKNSVTCFYDGAGNQLWNRKSIHFDGEYVDVGPKIESIEWQKFEIIYLVDVVGGMDYIYFWDSWSGDTLYYGDNMFNNFYIGIASDTERDTRFGYIDYIFVRKFVYPEPAVSIGSEEAVGYYSSGTYISSVEDTGKDSVFLHFEWDGSVPTGTDMAFYIRASYDSFSADNATLQWTYVGNASTATFFDISPLNIEGRYVQWKAEFYTADTSQTPMLDKAVVGYK